MINTELEMRKDDSKVRVIVHRGTRNIGGCCTEVAYNGTRIAIDFGIPLPEEKASKLNIPGLTTGESSFDAVLFTHYHGDHVGETGRLSWVMIIMIKDIYPVSLMERHIMFHLLTKR